MLRIFARRLGGVRTHSVCSPPGNSSASPIDISMCDALWSLDSPRKAAGVGMRVSESENALSALSQHHHPAPSRAFRSLNESAINLRRGHAESTANRVKTIPRARVDRKNFLRPKAAAHRKPEGLDFIVVFTVFTSFRVCRGSFTGVAV